MLTAFAWKRKLTLDSAKQVVLVVDDDEILLELATLELALLGYEALTARSAEDALSILRTPARVDLLFTDYRLPRASGSELGVAAKSLRPQLPVLLTSGLPDVSSPFPLLIKPYRSRELARAIRSAI